MKHYWDEAAQETIAVPVNKSKDKTPPDSFSELKINARYLHLLL
jgi:hypothetical protein